MSKLLGLLCVLGISAVINPLQLRGHRNIYGNDASTPKLTNVLKLSAGVLNFLEDNRRYLNQGPSDTSPRFGATFDFIVVGAGTAGAAVAARLSEVPQAEVLLIEAGSHESLLMDIPLVSVFLQLSDDINWKYQTKPSNKYCLGMEGNRCNYPRGRTAGGSSTLNYMIASRGSAQDYDRWAEMGNDGWAYKDILKYFKKLETIDIPELRSDIAYHGTEGPVHITNSVYRTPLAEAFLEAGKELGYPLVDYNGKDIIGFSYVQATIMNGTRMSSNRAYLHPSRFRKNLHVTLKSMVSRVLIDSRKNRAIGVELTKNGRTMPVFASKEVILCAGTIGSSQLLMLSGIGPAKDLTELGISVVRDAPVGENLMDHVYFMGLTWTIDVPISLQMFNYFNPLKPYLADFLLKRTGPLTVPCGIEAIAFVDTKHPGERSGPPDMELLIVSLTNNGEFIIPITLNLNAHVRRMWNRYLGSYGFFIAPILQKPRSRGRITLLANDVNVKPEIVPNYFDDPEDVRTMIAGIRSAISIAQMRAMQAFGPQLSNVTYPGCERHDYDSDAFWECAIRTISSTLFHISGTCKMSPRGDPTAVVDPRLKVIGVQGLRVADASIMPEIVSGHINVPIYMIAEKAADMIKEEWGYFGRSRS